MAPLGWADLDLMFVTSVGTILDRKTLRKDIDAIQKPAKLTRIRLYATRSTHGSLLADMGVNLHALAERLGHTDPRYTARVYLQGPGSVHRVVAERFGRSLEEASRGNSGADGPGNPVGAGGGEGSDRPERALVEATGGTRGARWRCGASFALTRSGVRIPSAPPGKRREGRRSARGAVNLLARAGPLRSDRSLSWRILR